jgi:hypothetical protein
MKGKGNVVMVVNCEVVEKVKSRISEKEQTNSALKRDKIRKLKLCAAIFSFIFQYVAYLSESD